MNIEHLGFEIICCSKLPEEYDEIIDDGFAYDAKSSRGLEANKKSFAFICVDNSKNFIGVIDGSSLYGSLHIGNLFVSKNFRKLNYGSLLMQKAEVLARQRNCRFITLNTFDWQARPFYEKLGFKLEFIRKGYDKDSERYYLRKDLI